MSLSLRRKIAAGSLSGGGNLSIVSVELLTPLNVAYNTAFGSLSLPTNVDVTLNDDSIVSMAVTWIDSYDPQAPGTQTILGDLTLPSGVANPFLIQAAIDVIVAEEIFTETFTVTGFHTWEVPAGVEELIYAEGIAAGGAGGGLGSGATGSAGGGGGASYARGNNLPVTAGELVCYYVPPATVSPVPSGSPVNGPDGAHFFFGPAAPAASTVLSGTGAPGGGTGSDGNYYYDTSTGELYGPKASGSWPGSPAAAWVKAEGGKGGTAAGVGGSGGLTANSLGDVKYAGGNGTNNAASRSGAGGGSAGKTGAGGNGNIVSGTNVVGGTGNSPGGNGGNGSSGASISGAEKGGGGGGRRTTSAVNGQGGSGEKGVAEIQYSGATVPPAAPGIANVYLLTGQSEMVGSSASTSPSGYLQVPLGAFIFINSATGFENLDWPLNNQGGTTNGFSSELTFGYDMNALANDEIFLVKKASSGASMFLNFNVANNSIGRSSVSTLIQALDYLDAQGKTVNFKGVCFMQGLGDMGENNPEYGNGGAAVKAAYKAQFIAWWEYLIDEVTDAGYDTSDAKLCVALTDYAYATNPLYQDEIVEAQQEVAALYGDDFTTADIGRGGDGVHPSSAGSELLGQRFADYHGPLL